MSGLRCPPHALTRGTKPGSSAMIKRHTTNGAFQGVVPFKRTAAMVIALLFSLLFVVCVSLAFLGGQNEELIFRETLDSVAETSPGIVMIGEDIDVDVDEPSVGVRWSVLGCGEGFVLNASQGILGSMACGLPAMSVEIFVDGADGSLTTYDPVQLPYLRNDGRRNNIENLYQFDSDHVLDVHLARFYPFDTYHLSTTFRASSPSTNATLPIQKIATLPLTSNFAIASNDTASYVILQNGTQVGSRDLELRIKRPGEARAFTMVLFHVGWLLAHAAVGLVVVAWASVRAEVLKHLVVVFGIALVVPQLRNAMPDAPGFDGVLLDTIGFFPQMILCSASGFVLLFLMLLRQETETEAGENANEVVQQIQTSRLTHARSISYVHSSVGGEKPSGMSHSREVSSYIHHEHGRTTSISFNPVSRPTSYVHQRQASRLGHGRQRSSMSMSMQSIALTDSSSPVTSVFPAPCSRPLSTICLVRDEIERLRRGKAGRGGLAGYQV